MNIAFLTADYPPVISGVGDYSYHLVKALKNRNHQIHVITSRNSRIVPGSHDLLIRWNISGLFRVIKFLKKHELKTINIQYPCSLYGKYNLWPHLYTIVLRLLKFRIVTTLHEFSNVNLLRKYSELVFFYFSFQIILTNSYDLQEAIRKIRFLKPEKLTVIPIGSNVESLRKSPPPADLPFIVFFGIFYPNKQIENVIEIMHRIDQNFPGTFCFRFVGGIHPYYPNYYPEFKQKAENRLNQTEWFINSPIENISILLKDAFLSVLYFQDGASLRRGSLLAMLTNGIPLITNKGPYSRELGEIEGRGLFYLSPEFDNVPEIIRSLQSEEFYRRCFEAMVSFSKKFDFENIAEQYEQVFNQIFNDPKE